MDLKNIKTLGTYLSQSLSIHSSITHDLPPLNLAILLDKFDPKTDGAARDWGSIYDESARL